MIINYTIQPFANTQVGYMSPVSFGVSPQAITAALPPPVGGGSEAMFRDSRRR